MNLNDAADRSEDLTTSQPSPDNVAMVELALEKLIELLNIESEHLLNPDPLVIEDIRKHKEECFEIYRQHLEYILQKGKIEEVVSLEKRQKLQSLQDKFKEASELNARRLNIAIEVSKKIMNVFATCAQESSNKLKKYGENGTIYQGIRPAAVSINQSI